MKRAFLFLLVAVFAVAGCVDPTTRMLQRERLKIRREIVDVSAEVGRVMKMNDAAERLLTQALEERNDQRMRADITSRIASLRSEELEILSLLHALAEMRRDGDRILWVGMTDRHGRTCYVLVRDGAIIARGGVQEWIE